MSDYAKLSFLPQLEIQFLGGDDIAPIAPSQRDLTFFGSPCA